MCCCRSQVFELCHIFGEHISSFILRFCRAFLWLHARKLSSDPSTLISLCIYPFTVQCSYPAWIRVLRRHQSKQKLLRRSCVPSTDILLHTTSFTHGHPQNTSHIVHKHGKYCHTALYTNRAKCIIIRLLTFMANIWRMYEVAYTNPRYTVKTGLSYAAI